MIIGAPTNPRKKLLKEIEWIGKNGFDFVDLFLEEDLAVPEKNSIRKIKIILQKYNLQAVGHLAYYLPTGSAMKSLREASIIEAEKYFIFFKNIGVEYVTIHGNWMGGMFSEKECINFQIETLRKLVKNSERHNLKLVYEPIDTKFDSIKNISEILRCVNDLGLHLDIGHANLHGRNPQKFIKFFKGKIKRIHISDNDGKNDLHLPIGDGNINWRETIKMLKKTYNGTITLEIFSGKKGLLSSKRKILELWNNIV